jgi:hypothetical protein
LLHVGTAHKWVVGRDGVGIAVIDIDTNNGAEEIGGVLGISQGGMPDRFIVRIAAITDRDVEIAVRAKGDIAAIVIELRLIDL